MRYEKKTFFLFSKRLKTVPLFAPYCGGHGKWNKND
jgi:hypothetical protein